MSTLILYSTKSGASQECAELLANKITDCVVCDIKNSTLEIESFDTIIIGSGVRMGKLYKPVISFIRENTTLLLSKQFAIYLCNAYPNTFQKAIEKNIPQELIKHSVCIKSFGGKPPFTSPQNSDWIIKVNIDTFVNEVSHIV